ncbi:MAG: glycine cleavage system protein H, partial [Sulfolobaceae archaeon]|nr:glycine cleavage system protein H [Sulfolobales archaeon]
MGEIRVGKYVILDDRLYTETDEWVKLEGNTAIVGVT